MSTLRSPLEVLVAVEVGGQDEPPTLQLVEASVQVLFASSPEWIDVGFDQGRGIHTADLGEDPLKIRVSRVDHLPEERQIQARRPPLREVFFLVPDDEEHQPLSLGGGVIPVRTTARQFGFIPGIELSREDVWHVFMEIVQKGYRVQLGDGPVLDMGMPPPPGFLPQPIVLPVPPDPDAAAALLIFLRRYPGVAGPTIRPGNATNFTILTDEVVVRFRSAPLGAIDEARQAIMSGFEWLTEVERLPGPVPQVLWRASPELGLELVGKIKEISETIQQVESVELKLAGAGPLHGALDPAHPFQRSLTILRVAEARAELPDPPNQRLIAILDSPYEFGGLTGHPEFLGRLVEGFTHPTVFGPPNWGSNVEHHGLACLGIALAASNSAGVLGIMPESWGLAGGIASYNHDQSLLRAARTLGPDGTSTTDVISSSLAFDEGSAHLSRSSQQTLEALLFEGRQGRGCPVFLSAGNFGGRELDLYLPFRASPYTLTCGASAMNTVGINDNAKTVETWASYSDQGSVDWCAPAFEGMTEVPSTGSEEHPPIIHLFPSPSPTTLRWPGTDQIPGPDTLLVLAKAAHTAVVRTKSATTVGNTTQVELHDCPWTELELSGATVRRLPWTVAFGQTSAATPMCAGVGLLVLSADPFLSALELRELLRETAEREALRVIGTDNPIAWASMPHDRLGYGRLDALRAVQTAIERRGDVAPRDWPLLCIASAWFTVSGKKSAFKVRHGRDHELRIVIENRGQRTGLEAWVRAFIAPNAFVAADWMSGSVQVGEQVAFHSVAVGERREIRLSFPATAVPDWPELFLRVDLLPHNGPYLPNGEGFVGAAAERPRTRYISGSKTIYPELPPEEPAPG